MPRGKGKKVHALIPIFALKRWEGANEGAKRGDSESERGENAKGEMRKFCPSRRRRSDTKKATEGGD